MTTSTSTPGLRSALRRWWRGLWAPAVGKTYARGYHRSMLFIFTAVSVILNSGHSALQGRGAVEIIMAAAVAAVPPLALLAATHSVIAFIRHTTKRIVWVTRVQVGLAVLMAGIGGVAFRASFVALSDMGERMHMRPGDGWMLPTIVDSMIVISTIALVVVEKERALDAVEAEASRHTLVEQEPVDEPAVDGVHDLVASPTSSPSTSTDELLDTPSTTPTSSPDELPDDLVVTPSTSTDELLDAATSWADEHPVDTVELHPTSSSRSTRHPADQLVRRGDDLDGLSATSPPIPGGDMLDDLVVTPTTSADEQSDELVVIPTSSPDELTDDLVDMPDDLDLDVPSTTPKSSPDDVVVSPTTSAVELLDEHRQRADAVVATSKISAAADELAIVLALDAEGLSKQAIADRVGRSRSTVTGWIKAAESVRPQLELVGGRSVGNE